MAMDGILLVSSSQMVEQADRIRNHLSKIRSSFQRFKELTEKTAGCWNGEASDMHRKAYLNQIDNIESVLRRYEEQIHVLETMAGVYEEGEHRAASAADSLPVSEL